MSFRSEYARSFTRAYDVYLEFRHRVEIALDQLLFPSELEQYKGMCPCCIATLPEEEDELELRMLIAMDGNESLKQSEMQRRTYDANGNQTGVINIERADGRRRPSLLFIEPETVDRYRNEVKRKKPQVSFRFFG